MQTQTNCNEKQLIYKLYLSNYPLIPKAPLSGYKKQMSKQLQWDIPTSSQARISTQLSMFHLMVWQTYRRVCTESTKALSRKEFLLRKEESGMTRFTPPAKPSSLEGRSVPAQHGILTQFFPWPSL